MSASSIVRLLSVSGVLVFFVLAAILGGEGFARLRHPCDQAGTLLHPLLAVPDGLFLPDEELVRRPRPDYRIETKVPACRVALAFDENGLRAPDRLPPDDAPIWLALGDERTMALTVPHDRIWAARLGLFEGARVRNAGVNGDSTWQALGRYQRYTNLLPYIERVILLFHVGSDVIDNTRFHRQLQVHRAMHGAEAPSVYSPTEIGLFRFSALFSWWRLDPPWRGRGPSGERWRSELLTFHRGYDDSRILPQSRAALEQLKQLTSGRGQALTVVVAPHILEALPQYVEESLRGSNVSVEDFQPDRPRARVLEMLSSLQIETCDVTDALKALAEQGGEPYFLFNREFTPEGHEAVAQAIHDCL